MSDSQRVGGEISRVADLIFVAIIYVATEHRLLTSDINLDEDLAVSTRERGHEQGGSHE